MSSVVFAIIVLHAHTYTLCAEVCLFVCARLALGKKSF